ncbi:MAG: RNA polymerase sigma-54 factor, partial [Pseudomonadota bacterium]|nr:RNA polymerase sigma-54 factor [Pseudomonadota bacterium]
MRISQRMQAKQSQKLHLSPQLQQSILVLQMNNLELAELLQAEAEKNPFLEIGEGDEQVVSREETDGAVIASGEAASSEDMGESASPDGLGADGVSESGDLATLDDVITRGHLGDATLEAEDEGWREETHSNVGEFL